MNDKWMRFQRYNKGTFSIVSLLVFIAQLSSFSLNAKPITLCTSPSWIPHVWEHQTGANGVVYHVFTQFLEHESLQYDFVPMDSWARCLKQTKEGKVNIVLGAYKTPYRAQWGYLSMPVAYDETKAFYTNKKLKISTLNDLINLTGASRKDSSYGEPIDSFYRQQEKVGFVIPTFSDEAILQLLDKGRIDYFAGVDGNTNALLAKLKQEKKIKNITQIYSSVSFSRNGLYVIASKKWSDGEALINKFNQYFLKHYDTKKIEQLEAKKMQQYLSSIEQ